MIELMLFEWLKKELTPTKVYMEEPKDAEERFVLIEKTGGTESVGLSTATIAIQSYESSKFKAAKLNEIVKLTISKMVDSNDVVKAELNSDYPFTDTNTGRYRYQAVYDITYYKN